MVDFPNNPLDGDTHIENGTEWVWNDVPGAWSVVVSNVVPGAPVEIVEDGTNYQVVGDVMIQWGTGTTAAGTGEASVTFPIAFENIPSVTATSGGDANIRTLIIMNDIITVAGFDVRTANNDNVSVPEVFWWMAIGEAPDSLKKPKTVQLGGVNEGSSTDEEFHDPTEQNSWQIIGNTLEQWGIVQVTAGAATFSYAKAFARKPSVTLTCQAPGGTVAFAETVQGGDTETQCQIFAYDQSADAAWATGWVYWQAKGEWDGVS